MRTIAGVVVVALAVAAPCAAAPTVLPGWPVPAAPGPVLQRWVNARTAAAATATRGPSRSAVRVLWRSPVSPLSLAQGGLPLVALRQGSTRALRAPGLVARPRRSFRTSGVVLGARELTDRTVAVATDGGDGRGPLWRIGPG